MAEPSAAASIGLRTAPCPAGCRPGRLRGPADTRGRSRRDCRQRRFRSPAPAPLRQRALRHQPSPRPPAARTGVGGSGRMLRQQDQQQPVRMLQRGTVRGQDRRFARPRERRRQTRPAAPQPGRGQRLALGLKTGKGRDRSFHPPRHRHRRGGGAGLAEGPRRGFVQRQDPENAASAPRIRPGTSRPRARAGAARARRPSAAASSARPPRASAPGATRPRQNTPISGRQWSRKARASAGVIGRRRLHHHAGLVANSGSGTGDRTARRLPRQPPRQLAIPAPTAARERAARPAARQAGAAGHAPCPARGRRPRL
jgi:hypothetical protein